MKLKKNIVLIVGVSIFALLLAVGLLIQLRSSYEKVRRDFDAAMARLNALNRRDPFPSAKNVATVQSNLFLLQNFYDELLAHLRKGQTEPVQMEAARFANTLQITIQKLHSRASTSGIKLPEQRFSFGFEKYAKGDLPAQADVPRLTVQLQMIAELCDLLFKAKVSEIMGVGRQVFEQRVSDGGGPSPGLMPRPMSGALPFALSGRAGGTDALSVPLFNESAASSGLFERERFILKFKARDRAVWDLLNAINKSKLFILVVSMELANIAPVAKQFTSVNPDALAAKAAAKGAVLGPEERIVAGKEEVIATLTVDVYRFPSVIVEEGAI